MLKNLNNNLSLLKEVRDILTKARDPDDPRDDDRDRTRDDDQGDDEYGGLSTFDPENPKGDEDDAAAEWLKEADPKGTPQEEHESGALAAAARALQGRAGASV